MRGLAMRGLAMNAIALFTILLAASLANAQADANATPQSSPPPSPTPNCAAILKGSFSLPAMPLRLAKGAKLVITETDDATINGQHSHAVMTAAHTITQASKTEIRFDTHNVLNSSSGEYFALRGDEVNQEFPIDPDHLAGESGVATDFYVETPVFNGTVRVLYRHDLAAGEIWRWVSTDPVEFDLKLEDASKVRVRAVYTKELILLNGIKSFSEGFSLYDFGFMPVWTRDTSERPGGTEEIIQALTAVEQPAQPLRMARGTRFTFASQEEIIVDGEHRNYDMTSELTITGISKNFIRYDSRVTHSSQGDSDTPPDEENRRYFIADPAKPDKYEQEWLRNAEFQSIDVDTAIFRGRLSIVHHRYPEEETWIAKDPIELDLQLGDGSRVKVRAIYHKVTMRWTETITHYEEGFKLQDFLDVVLWQHMWGCNYESTVRLVGVEQPAAAQPQSH